MLYINDSTYLSENEIKPTNIYPRTSTPIPDHPANPVHFYFDLKYWKFVQILHQPPNKLKVRGIPVPPQDFIAGHIVLKGSCPCQDTTDLFERICQQLNENILDEINDLEGLEQSLFRQRLDSILKRSKELAEKTAQLFNRNKKGRSNSCACKDVGSGVRIIILNDKFKGLHL